MQTRSYGIGRDYQPATDFSVPESFQKEHLQDFLVSVLELLNRCHQPLAILLANQVRQRIALVGRARVKPGIGSACAARFSCTFDVSQASSPGNHRQPGSQTATRFEPPERRAIVRQQPGEDIGAQVFDIRIAHRTIALIGGAADARVDQPLEAARELCPCRSVARQQLFD